MCRTLLLVRCSALVVAWATTRERGAQLGHMYAHVPASQVRRQVPFIKSCLGHLATHPGA